jgi:hypothetical protein
VVGASFLLKLNNSFIYLVIHLQKNLLIKLNYFIMGMQGTTIEQSLKTSSMDKTKLEKLIGKSLGNPINGRNEGDKFSVTLTGNIVIRDYKGAKSAAFETKEGYFVAVNNSFDKNLHKENAVFNCICKIIPADANAGRDRDIKFTSFYDGK